MSIMPLCPLTATLAPEHDPGPSPSLLPARGDKAVVIGSGRSGRAAARLLARMGARVHLLEASADHLDDSVAAELAELNVTVELGAHRPEQFQDARFVIPSPGVPLRTIFSLMNLPVTAPLERAGGPCILAETELAFRCLQGEKVLAVTGTSGKTTTVHLMTAMLEAAGKKVCLAGNVGTPLSEYILSGGGSGVVVLEISSFQLQTCLRLHPHVAVLMNITPNHLDYHEDMAEYTAAKMRLFACQNENDLALVPEEWQGTYREAGYRARVLAPRACGRFPQTRLLGPHNALNAEIAWQAVSPLGVSLEDARRAVADFSPLPHRLEQVAEKGGVLYVNDSKCTTLSSLETALKAMDRPVLLLCGGHFKGGDPHVLDDLIREKVRCIAGFGDAREVFLPAWGGLVPMQWFATLKPAVHWLHEQARSGDVILLSPATASFDLYRGMAYRGADFKAIVGELQ